MLIQPKIVQEDSKKEKIPKILVLKLIELSFKISKKKKLQINLGYITAWFLIRDINLMKITQ
jgi:hypothetical protein